MSRRLLASAALLAALCACTKGEPPAPAPPASAPTARDVVLFLGDSLTAGYGVAQEQAVKNLPAALGVIFRRNYTARPGWMCSRNSRLPPLPRSISQPRRYRRGPMLTRSKPACCSSPILKTRPGRLRIWWLRLSPKPVRILK